MIDKSSRSGHPFEAENEQDYLAPDLESDLRRVLQMAESGDTGDLAARIAAVLRTDMSKPAPVADDGRTPSVLEALVGQEQAMRPARAGSDPQSDVSRDTHRTATWNDPTPPQALSRAAHKTAAAPGPDKPLTLDEEFVARREGPVSHDHVPQRQDTRQHRQPSTSAPTHEFRTDTAVMSHPDLRQPAPALPADFTFADEHPLIHLPFTLQLGNRRFEGQSLSLTHLVVSADGAGPVETKGRQIARLQVHFDGFDLTLQPEVAVADTYDDGSMALYFADPTGPHLPQLRYVLNNTISGDVTTLNGLLSYTGPTNPKAPKAPAPPATMTQRMRSIAMAAVSAVLVMAALVALYSRYTTGYEMHPVFVDRSGQQMRATAAGQIGYINPDAKQGDVVFSVNANTGDVLNFALPCDCTFAVSSEVEEGTTVLPSDLILTIFRNTSEIRAKTMISVEGLARAMEGDKVILDLNDGRSIPVEVVLSQATSASALSGGLFVPVQLKTTDGVLSAEDVGKNGRLRITSSVFSRLGLN